MKIYNDNLIKKWEQLRLEAYKPTKDDVWTIGWGHTKGVVPGQTITEVQAQKFFDEDVAWVEAFMAKHIKVGLSQNQYDALASWVFNIGETNAAKSTLVRKLNAKDYEGAARELPRWNKQNGKVLKGLTKRRAEEMEYFLAHHPSTALGNVKPDAVTPLKPLTSSKETLGGLLMALVGAGAPFLAANTEELLWGLSAALVGFGLFFVINRVVARYKGKR